MGRRSTKIPTFQQRQQLRVFKTMTYNGWTNYETWNVALWLDNDYESYQLARTCKNFREYRKAKNLRGEPLTGDHISLFDDKLNIKELDDKIRELGE